MPRRRLPWIAALLMLFFLTAHGQEIRPLPEHPKLLQSFGALPMGFEQNRGQADDNVRFLSRGAGYSVYLSRGEMLLAFNSKNKSQLQPELVHISLANADQSVEPQGSDLLPGVTNYYVGNDPAKWHTGIRQFRQVKYPDVYPGVDLVFYGNRQQLEFDFNVAPDSDPSRIALRVEGALVREFNGNLELATPSGIVAVLKKPELYQAKGKTRHAVAGHYILTAANQIAFKVGAYNHRESLVIDPALIYSTLAELDTNGDQPLAIAADSAGAAYVTGWTQPSNGVIQLFVMKLDPTGSNLVYQVHLGGTNGGGSNSASAVGQQIVVDNNQNAYVAGLTNDLDFPTTNGTFSTTPACSAAAISCTEPFALELSPGGTLVYSTFLVPAPTATAGLDKARPVPSSIFVDASGALYATGTTVQDQIQSTVETVAGLVPTPGAFQATRPNNSSAFVLKLHAGGTAMDYATYLGGSTGELPGGIAADASGIAYVDGGTSSSDFPTTNGAFQTTNAGTSAFFSKLKADGSGLLYSTFLGASGSQSSGMAIALDGSQSAYLTGITTGPNFPTTSGAFKTNVAASGSFNFVSKFDSSNNLAYSTYVGDGVSDRDGGLGDVAPTLAIGVDNGGNAYVGGSSDPASYPSSGSIFTPPVAGGVFVTKLNPTASALVYSTFFPFGTSLFPFSTPKVGIMNADAGGNVYVAGIGRDASDPSSPQDLIPGGPTTVGAFQTLPKPPLTCGFLPCPNPRMFVGKIASSLGSAVAVVNPHQVIFSTILTQGTASAPRTLQLYNYGDADLAVSNIAISGTNASEFTISSNTCGANVAIGGSCTFLVTFTPTVASGTRTATLNLTFGGGLSAQSVPLTGQAGFPVFQASPATVDFGNQGSAFPDFCSLTQRFLTVTNTGTGPLHFSNVTVTGSANTDFVGDGPTCSPAAITVGDLAPGATEQVLIRFFPHAPGLRTAQLVLQDNASGSPHTIQLSANSVDGNTGNGNFTILPATSGDSSRTVTAGQTATYNVMWVTGSKFTTVPSITFSCTGAPAGASCTVPASSPGNVPGNASGTFTATVTTTAHTASLFRPLPKSLGWTLACAFAVVLIRPRKRKWRRILLASGALLVMATLVSCSAGSGGGGGGGGGGGSGTPSGTYTITVTATANGASNSVPLTLTVQ